MVCAAAAAVVLLWGVLLVCSVRARHSCACKCHCVAGREPKLITGLGMLTGDRDARESELRGLLGNHAHWVRRYGVWSDSHMCARQAQGVIACERYTFEQFLASISDGEAHRQGLYWARQSKILTSRPLFFQNGAKSGFEMCFGPSTQGAGAKTRLESRIKKFTPHCICRPCTLERTRRTRSPMSAAGGLMRRVGRWLVGIAHA